MATTLLLAACASAPPPRFHSLLASTAEAVPAAPASGAARLLVVLDPVRVPVQVDQPQWLVRMPDDSLALLESERWASPLRDQLQQALLDVLVARFGVDDARAAGSGKAGWRVSVELRRFESIPGREAHIGGVWSIAPMAGGGVRANCAWSIHEPVQDGMLALAAGHRRAVARLAESIGTQLVRLQRGDAAVCPP